MDRQSILERARECVCGQREQDYGTPENNFGRIARLWSDYTGCHVSPIDVAMMMALLKIARVKSGTGTEDSFVDIAGYAACGGEIAHMEGVAAFAGLNPYSVKEEKIYADKENEGA